MPGIFLGVKLQAHVFFWVRSMKAPSDPPVMYTASTPLGNLVPALTGFFNILVLHQTPSPPFLRLVRWRLFTARNSTVFENVIQTAKRRLYVGGHKQKRLVF